MQQQQQTKQNTKKDENDNRNQTVKEKYLKLLQIPIILCMHISISFHCGYIYKSTKFIEYKEKVVSKIW